MSEHPELKLYAKFTDKRKFDFSVERLNYSVVFILECGSFAYSIEDQPERLAQPGDVICCPAKQAFRRRVLEPVTLHVLRFEACDGEIKGGAVELDAVTHERIKRDLAIYGSASFAFKQSFDHTERHFLLDIYYSIERFYKSGDPSEGRTDSQIASIKAKIDGGLGEKLSVNILAEEYGLTSAALIRRFKSCEGTTPMEYIIAQRIKKASRLLVETDLSIGEIALSCGFENGYYFSNSFKKRCSCSPSEFRRSARL